MGLTSGRLAAYGAIILSTFTIVINIICVPLLVNRITQMKIQIENGMERYKMLTNHASHQISAVRTKRQVNGVPFPFGFPTQNFQIPHQFGIGAQSFFEVLPPTARPIAATVATVLAAPRKVTPSVAQAVLALSEDQRCPVGPPGDAGLPGRSGMPGVAGVDGTPGYDWTKYVETVDDAGCIVCPQGPPGPKGARGPQGQSGPKGWKGVDGRPGSNGWWGPIGPEGFRGLAGLSGKPGKPGTPGKPAQGGRGKPGGKGIPGVIGRSGPQGIPGRSSFFRGMIGLQGSVGLPGLDGSDGRLGFPGASGASGYKGIDAKYCPCPKEISEAARNERNQHLRDYSVLRQQQGYPFDGNVFHQYGR